MKRWPTKLLVELCDVEGGNAAPQGDENYKDGAIPFVRMKDLGRPHFTNNLTETDDKLTEASATANRMKFFEPGCVLFPRSGSVALNHRAILGVRACIVSHIGVLQNLRSEILPGFLYLYLTTFDMTALSKKTTGVDSIAFADVKKIPVPVPPLAEQERIVELLDEADELRKLRAEADYRAATLIPALFHGLFDNPDSKNWKEYSFADSDILEIIDGDRGTNYPKKFDFREEGHCLFLNTSNVRKGAFDFSKCDFVTREKDATLRKGKLTRGDVILTTRGTLGNSAHYDQTIPYDNVRINSGMVILRANPKMLLSEFLLVILNSDEFTNQVSTMTSGSAQPQLPINRLMHITFSLPPLQLQKEFVQQVKEIRELEASQATSRTRLDALFQSMLHRAFNGEI